MFLIVFSRRRRHTRCALVTGVQTCALPISNRMPVLFDTAIDNMRQGMEAGVVQPRALMEKVVPQLDALIKDKAEDTLLWGPIKSMPGDFSDADKKRLTAAYREMIEG